MPVLMKNINFVHILSEFYQQWVALFPYAGQAIIFIHSHEKNSKCVWLGNEATAEELGVQFLGLHREVDQYY